ncbi:MAG: bacteriohemerythrin [Candidatus Scalindua sp.]
MIAQEYKYNLYVSLIIEDHKKLIGIIDKAIAAKQHKKSPEEMKEILHDIIRHAIKYFATEEIYMIEFKYPEYQYHKESHMNFSIKALAYHNRIINSDYQTTNEMLEYLKQWLINHFQETDKKYTEYLRQNGHIKSLHYSP